MKERLGQQINRRFHHNNKKEIIKNRPNNVVRFYSSNNSQLIMNYYNSIENQQKIMEELFQKLNLIYLEDWNFVTLKSLSKFEGTSFLRRYYSNNRRTLLETLYPHYPWQFNEVIPYSQEYFKEIDNQREFMNELYEKFELKSLEEWFNVPKYQFIRNSGKNLFILYSNDYKKLLSSIYPDYHWKFDNNIKINSNEYFKAFNNQVIFMDDLYKKLDLKSLDDWLKITRKLIIRNGGKSLILTYYSNDLKKLLQSIYPNFPWKFDDIKMNKIDYFKLIDNQRKFMDKLFDDFQLKSLDDWLLISRKKIIENGGKRLMLTYYNNDIKLLLSRIYPNYAWRFDELKVKSNEYFKSIENQMKFMNKLFNKFKMKTLDDWLNISKNLFIKQGGQSLLNYYSNNMKKLLISIYPHHSWSFESIKISSNSFFKSQENQRKFMDDLFIKFKLNSLDDWKKISRNKIIQNGGKSLILHYYSNDFKKLLSSIYPDHQWQFDDLLNSHLNDYFKSIENQQKFMSKLFTKFQLKSMNDWLTIPKHKIIRNGGERLLLYCYSNNMQKLLFNIFPNYPWDFDILSINPHEYFKSINNQRKFMDKLFDDFQLKSLDDWLLISRKKIIQSGGQSLMLTYYNNDIKLLLSRIYPNYAWRFDELKVKSNEYFKSIENQMKFMNKLFNKFKMKTLGDWLFISKTKFEENGGHSLLHFYYSNDMKKLLSILYPHYPWQFDILGDIKLTETQISIMNNLFQRLNLKSLNDWLQVSRFQFLSNGGKKILHFYSNDIEKLLSSVYPNINWDFEKNRVKYKPNFEYSKSFEYLSKIIKYWTKKYSIKEKKDWYRLPIKIDEIEVYKSLKFIYSDDRWDKRLFTSKSKKITQRLVQIEIQNIYPSYLLLENYRHPYLLSSFSIPLEFDIFIPALNFAFEYQGQQHYDDLPARFNSVESSQFRDSMKKYLSWKNSIRLILVPYWWDLSADSLISSIHSRKLQSK